MNAGEYNRKINLLYDVNKGKNITDDNGSPIENWQIYKTIWVKKEGMTGKGMRIARFIYAAGGNQTVLNRIYRTRYRTDITADMRVQDGTSIYLIKDPIDVDGNREEMFIICEGVENHG